MKTARPLLAALALAACSPPASSIEITLGAPTHPGGDYVSLPVAITNRGSTKLAIATAECGFYSNLGHLVVSGQAIAVDLEPGSTAHDNIIVLMKEPLEPRCRAVASGY